MNGQLLAGTTKGVFAIDDAGSRQTLEARHVRDLVTVASAPTAFSHYKDEGGAHAGLYRSDDHGQSWRSLCDDAHLPSPVNFHGLITDPDNVGGVLVGTDTGEVWQVSDDAEWAELGSGLPLGWSLAVV